jgi:hypothetical protein
MARELKKMLADLGMTDEQSAPVLAALEPHKAQLLAEFDTLDTKTAEIATAQTELRSANERLNAEAAEWAKLRADGEPMTAQMRTDLADSQAEITRLTSHITSLAAQAGVDPKTILKAAKIVPNTDDLHKPQPVDLSGYVKAEDVRTALAGVMDYAITLPAELQSIASEHQALTGQILDTRPLVAEIKARAADKANKKPVDVRTIWEEQYQIPAKRDAKTAAERATEIKAAEDRGFERARTEQVLPGSQPTSHVRSTVLRVINGPEHKSGLTAERQRPMSGVPERISRAASSLARHRVERETKTA